MSKASELQELLAPVIEEAGYECVEVTFEKEGRDWVLTAYIDNGKPDGISLDDCQAVSEILSPFLDEKDPIGPSYLLNVSSPGIDRPLKTERDYERKIGEKIEVKLYAKKDGKKDYEGVLKSIGDGVVTLETEDGEVSFGLQEISKAAPVVEF